MNADKNENECASPWLPYLLSLLSSFLITAHEKYKNKNECATPVIMAEGVKKEYPYVFPVSTPF
jgi:hypothetical protein